MVTLTKKRTLMKLKDTVGAYVVFGQDVDFDETPTVLDIAILQDDWHDFGNPEVITVTIEPGDELNI